MQHLKEVLFISSTRLKVIFVISLALLFFFAGLFQVWPELGTDFLENPGDDWSMYHARALDILQNGLTMPIVNGPYTTPAGFLYVYFLALCYQLLGTNHILVFLVQSAMLGCSVGLLYLTFQSGQSLKAQIILLVCLTAFAYVDIQRHYAMRLLSENLFILEVSSFFILLSHGYAQNKNLVKLMALALLGPMYLTRPNILPFIPVLFIWLIYKEYKQPESSYRFLFWGALVTVLWMQLLGLRNYLVADQWLIISPLTWSQAVDNHLPTPWYFLEHPLDVALSMIKRFLYAIGFMPLIVPTYSPRPHWIAMWGAYLMATILAWRKGQPTDLRYTLLHIYVICVLGPIILVGHITGYGFRFLVPIVLPAIAGAVRIIDMYEWPKYRKNHIDS